MKSISIKNYKNLKDLKIDSLSKVNLIVGMNNSGKSSLLEAISILPTRGNYTYLKNILEFRGVNISTPINVENNAEIEMVKFANLYSDRDIARFHSDPISISASYRDKDISIKIKIADLIIEQIKDDTGQIISRRREVKPSDDMLHLSNIIKCLALYEDDEISPFFVEFGKPSIMLSKAIFTSQYVRVNEISNQRNAGYFDRISLTDLEKELINALNIIDLQIEAINFLNEDEYSNTRVAKVLRKGSDEKILLSTMGDGINRILTIVLAMLNCKGGVLLVDEFDNGLHYSVQTKLWKMVYRLADKLKIQVFATTHSDDCIKSFIEADENGDGKLIRLENRDGDIISVPFDDQERLRFAINNGVEVR